LASSFNSLRDLDGEEPVTLTSSSSVKERVDEDLVEMRPLKLGVSGTIVMSVLGGETSRTYKEKAWRGKTHELRNHPRRKDPYVGKVSSMLSRAGQRLDRATLPSAGKQVTRVTHEEIMPHVFTRLARVGSCNPFQTLPNAGKHVTGVAREETAQHVFPRLTSVAVFDWSTVYSPLL